MEGGMFLVPAEVAELTGRRRRAGQREALTAMGIAYRVRPDGTAAVLRSVAEVALGKSKPTEGTHRPRLNLPPKHNAMTRS